MVICSLGICIVSGFPDANFTPAKASTYMWSSDLLELGGAAGAGTHGLRDGPLFPRRPVPFWAMQAAPGVHAKEAMPRPNTGGQLRRTAKFRQVPLDPLLLKARAPRVCAVGPDVSVVPGTPDARSWAFLDPSSPRAVSSWCVGTRHTHVPVREPRGWELWRETAVQGRPHTGCTPGAPRNRTPRRWAQGSRVELKS